MFSWLRVKFVLGRTVLNVMPPPKKFVLIGTFFVLVISAAYFPWLFTTADAGSWYSDERIIMSVLTALTTFAGAYGAFLDERIREEGIHVRRIYTWAELLDYQMQGFELKISTTQTKGNGQPREIAWNLHNERLVEKVVAVLEQNGVRPRPLQAKEETLLESGKGHRPYWQR